MSCVDDRPPLRNPRRAAGFPTLLDAGMKVAPVAASQFACEERLLGKRAPKRLLRLRTDSARVAASDIAQFALRSTVETEISNVHL